MEIGYCWYIQESQGHFDIEKFALLFGKIILVNINSVITFNQILTGKNSVLG